MAFDSRACRQCGEAVPADARFCPSCGLGQEVALLDPLGVATGSTGSDGPATHGSAQSPRRGLLVTMAVLAGAVGLIWALSRGGVDRPEPDSAAPAGAEAGQLTSTTVPATTESTTVGSSTTSPPTTAPSARSLVGDAPGPVLGPDVQGVVVALVSDTMHRIDLATGDIESTDLYWSLFSIDPGPAVVIDGELISGTASGGLVAATDLATGLQRPVGELDLSDDDFAFVVGEAGPGAVWVATQGADGHKSAFALDVESGEIDQLVDLTGPFWVAAGRGEHLYLSMPGGAWRYEPATGLGENLGGEIIAWSAGAVMLISCDPSLQCAVRIESDGGSIAVPGPVEDELVLGSIQISPDLSGLLLHPYDAGPTGAVVYIDLVTGQLADLGDVPLAPYRDPLWLPDTPWVLGLDDRGGTDIVALNTATAHWSEIDLPVSGGFDGSGYVLLDPAG